MIAALIVLGFFLICTAVLLFLCSRAPELPDEPDLGCDCWACRHPTEANRLERMRDDEPSVLPIRPPADTPADWYAPGHEPWEAIR